MKYIYCIASALLLSFISCKQNNNSEKDIVETVKVESKKCLLDQAENTILNLDEVKIKEKLIDSISNHKKGISFMSDSLDIDGKKFYEIKTGYNSEIRFEIYYTFFIEKGNCENIKILDPIEGNTISLSSWRKTINQVNNDSLILVNGNLKKINLPFSFYNYFKDGYSDEKYPSYPPSQKLIDFLISKDYNGETYKCFIITTKDNYVNTVVSISRGDSNYFVLVTAKANNILDFIEIGAIGQENPITFKILNNLSIEKYEGNLEVNKPFEKYQITDKGLINKVL